MPAASSQHGAGAPPAEPWDLWLDGARAPALNMAVDEALLLSAPRRGRPLLRFYRWDRNAVSIGYVQAVRAAPAAGGTVVRRPTGGGVVFHDHDFTYSVVMPAGHWLTGLDRTRSYAWINRAVMTGLQQCRVPAQLAEQEIPGHVNRQTMVCFRNPTRYDILAGERKVAGSAQRRMKSGILHQGSIHFGGPLPMTRRELAAAVRAAFEQVLHAAFAPFTPDAELLEAARTLAAERYATAAWTQRR